VILAILPAVLAQTKSPSRADGDWPMFYRDLAGTRYSPLTQINVSNVNRLKLAWSYRPAETGGRAGAEVTPLVISGVMYLPAGPRVVALEAETGREIWRHQVIEGLVANDRGVSYWPGDNRNPPRIFFTAGAGGLPTFTRLIALNARTGRIDPGFGREGVVDMGAGYRSAPTIFRNVLMVGSYGQEHDPLGIPGDSRAFDARTGARLWEFHSVPRPGETGHDTWQGESWKNRSGTNMWGVQATVDEQRGMVYMSFGAPSSTYYGGDRHGDNLFGSSVVAIDAETGKYQWHFQTVHHDIWDYDLPPAPALVDIVHNGARAPALVQAAKTGFLYILDRVTGKPIFGMQERPVPAGDVPGEWYAPTQPFPVKPPPLARIEFKPDDIVSEADTNAEHAKACRDLAERSGGLSAASIFLPFPFRPAGAPPRSLVSFPGFTGGANWGGAAVDPRSRYIYVFTQDLANIGWIQPYPEGFRHERLNEINPLPYDRGSEAGPGPSQRFAVAMPGPDGKPMTDHLWPCQKPPWGRLNAVNANTGEILWQAVVGITDQLPEGKRNTGRIGNAGPMVTAGGLVFLGATDDARFRAFDAKTGKELWADKLEYTASAIPITYRGRNGKQYVAVTAAGAGVPGGPKDRQALLVYALP
jgi:quinoprotein glucose dehydrogenase